MTDDMPFQKFGLGDRVQPREGVPFVIDAVWVRGGPVAYSSVGRVWYATDELSLAPKPPPYVPSEVRIVSRQGDGDSTSEYITWFRPETKAELAARHAIERAAYDAQKGGE